MSASRKQPVAPEDLSDLERDLILQCVVERADMVYLVDVTTALAGLPRSLCGQWFDEKLLEPHQKESYQKVNKQVNSALRRLFKANLVDIGREDQCSEGFKRYHSDIIESMRNGRYWRVRPQYKGQPPPLRVIEDHVAHHEVWANATDFNAVVKELGGKPDMIGLTELGREFASMMGAA